MPRRLRHTLQGAAFHVMNRAVRRTVLFKTKADYRAFVAVTCESLARFRIRVIAYCVMPNHWHFVVICDRIEDLSRWMHWLCGTHANRWNGAHGARGRGAVYQGRFKAVPVQKNSSLIRVCRYVERNALRKGLVSEAQRWSWSSLAAECKNCDRIPVESRPIPRPTNWIEFVNNPETESEVTAMRQALLRNQPIGDRAWSEAVAPFVGLSLRARGYQGKREIVPTPSPSRRRDNSGGR
jgi:putative transposase